MVTIAALLQNGDLHSTLNETEEQGNSIYKKILAQNQQIVESDPDIGSVYTMRKNTNGEIYFVVDAVNAELSTLRPPARLNEIYSEPGDALARNFSSMVEPVAEVDTYTDSWGTWLSAYAPFYRSDGRLEGIIGLDIDAKAVVSAQQSALNTSIIIFIALTFILAPLGWFIGSRIAEPFTTLTQAARKMATGQLGEITLAKSDDEIGQLGEAFEKMSRQLYETITGLEQRVAERTETLQRQAAELERVFREQQRRATELQTIAQVSRAISTVQNLEDLLPRITQVVATQFHFYHVGIFMVSSDKQYAVLRAANSEGGQRLLSRGHQLKVGETGIVGYVADTGNPRIALDTGEDAIFFNNPDLPNTHSEVALPLKSGNQIIGVLDVQSDEQGAFTQQDIELLGVLADQISVAIENARLYERTQNALAEAESIYMQYVRGEWKKIAKGIQKIGYRSSGSGTKAIEKPIHAIEVTEAFQTGEIQFGKDSKQSEIAIPIKIREEVIGVLSIQSTARGSWSLDEIDVATAVANRVAIALENARLLSESQKRAAKEKAISEITSKISSTANMEDILQTAAEELGKTLPISELVIHLKKDQA
jgi:GAF domain-containing protein/HAMP domain-containing protein